MGYGCASSGNIRPATYVVRPQDTLYSIAWRHDLDFQDLARWNNIGPDFRIEVGQVLQLQPGTRSLASRPATQNPTATLAPRVAPSPAAHAAPNPVSQPPRVGAPQPLAGVPASPAVSRCPRAAHSSGCGQPTDRRRRRPSPAAASWCSVNLGQAVRAACSGRVVYTGSGIRGYGNLIIIKHGENLLSAYAHNERTPGARGRERRRRTDHRAHGRPGAHQIAALYFEIRLNGKPVDPMLYLNGIK